ncbi:MAG: hypothetical protein QM757_43135 [Paludibaculum sp.]
MRKDATASAPGYLLRWNGEFGDVPDNYSDNVFQIRVDWNETCVLSCRAREVDRGIEDDDVMGG